MKRMVDKKEYVSPEDKFKTYDGNGAEMNLYSCSCYFEIESVSYDCVELLQFFRNPNINKALEINYRDEIPRILSEELGWSGTVYIYRGIAQDDNNVVYPCYITLNLDNGKLTFRVGSNTHTLDIDSEDLTIFGMELIDMSTGYSIPWEE